MGKLIRLFMVDGIPDGMRTMEISNMTVKSTIFPRAMLKDFEKREEAQKPGVYMLFGDSISDNDKPTLYIGEGDPVINRIKNHDANKDFWTEAFIFTSKDDYLTKTQIQYLESRLISLAKEANRVILNNIQQATEPTISEVDRAEVHQFLESIKVLTDALRLKFFDGLAKTAVMPSVNEVVYEYRIKDICAKMVIRDGKYILLSGSQVRLNNVESAPKPIQKLREELIKENVLVGNGNGVLTVEKDIQFNSPSYAAAVVSGSSVNGWISWKHNQKTLRDHELESNK